MEERDVLREENTLTISNLWATAKKKILLILALVVALAAVGALYSFFLVPQEYTATASLIVSVKPEKTVKTITGSDGKTYTIVDDSDRKARRFLTPARSHIIRLRFSAMITTLFILTR